MTRLQPSPITERHAISNRQTQPVRIHVQLPLTPGANTTRDHQPRPRLEILPTPAARLCFSSAHPDTFALGVSRFAQAWRRCVARSNV